MDSTGIEAVVGETPREQSTSTLSLDPEYLEVAMTNKLTGMKIPKMTTAQELRAFCNPLMGNAIIREAAAFPAPADPVVETKHEIHAFDGATISLTRFAQSHHLTPGQALRPAVYHIHGGGMIAGSVEIYAPLCRRNLASWDVQVFAISYRLAPESPAPGPVEDAFAGLRWLSENAASLGVDPARILLYGESAGGGIAAGTALLARDRGLSPPVAKQVLVYPMLDDRTRYGEGWPTRPFLAWSEADNKLGWSNYLGADRAGREEADVSVYEAPGRAGAKDLAGLPRAYIDTGGLDLFRDEDLRYAAKLLEAGVEVEFHLYPGLPHGFEWSVTPSAVGRALENRKRAILGA